MLAVSIGVLLREGRCWTQVSFEAISTFGGYHISRKVSKRS